MEVPFTMNVFFIWREGTQCIFVDWMNVVKFYHRTSKSFLSLQSSCLVPMFRALFPEHVAVSPSLCFSVVHCFPKWLARIGRVRIWSEEAEPRHVVGAHLNLSCFIEAVRLMDIRKEHLRIITITVTTTTSSVLQPCKSSSSLSPAK